MAIRRIIRHAAKSKSRPTEVIQAERDQKKENKRIALQDKADALEKKIQSLEAKIPANSQYWIDLAIERIRSDPKYWFSTYVYTADQKDRTNPVKKFPMDK